MGCSFHLFFLNIVLQHIIFIGQYMEITYSPRKESELVDCRINNFICNLKTLTTSLQVNQIKK